jgi:hypothetical protein
MRPKIGVQIPKRSARGQMVDGWVTTLPFGTIRPSSDGGLLQLIVSSEYDDLHKRTATSLDGIDIMVTTTESRDWLISWDRCYWRPFAIFGLRSFVGKLPFVGNFLFTILGVGLFLCSVLAQPSGFLDAGLGCRETLVSTLGPDLSIPAVPSSTMGASPIVIHPPLPTVFA